MPRECVFYAAVYPSSDRGVCFAWESIFFVTGLSLSTLYTSLSTQAQLGLVIQISVMYVRTYVRTHVRGKFAIYRVHLLNREF